MNDCKHKFNYMGLQYAHGRNNMPGSGAVHRYYAHVFFCEKCLAKRADPASYGEQSSYSQVADGATAGDRKIIVPERDQ